MALILDGTTGVPVTTVTGTLPVANGGTGVTTSTGTGAVVLGTSPTLATPTFDSAQLATVSGTAPLYMCRAWVNFNGTGTVAIRASGNVSSITDSGTGDYTVNFTTAMPDANYAISGSGAQDNTGSQSVLNLYSNTARLVGSSRINTVNGVFALADMLVVAVSIFR
jgi:hypothetical protein